MMVDIPIRDTRNPGHFWADNELVDDYLPQIGAYGFAVYMLLCKFARAGLSKVSIAKMAKLLSVSEPTIRKAIRALVKAKLIDADEADHTAKTYTLLDIKSQKRAKPDLGVGLNDVDRGAKPDLPGGVNQVDPIKTNTKTIQEKESQSVSLRSTDCARDPQPEPTPEDYTAALAKHGFKPGAVITQGNTVIGTLGNPEPPSPQEAPAAPPSPPANYLWLGTSVSDGALHLIEDKGAKTNYQRQHTLCGALVSHRVKASPGLACLARPCPDCQRAATETNLLVYALTHVTGADARLNPSVRDLARDLQQIGYVAEDVAKYEVYWRKGWQWQKTPGCKPTPDVVRANIAAVKSDLGQSKYEAAHELSMRIRELRSGQPIGDRRLDTFKDEDDGARLQPGWSRIASGNAD